MSVIEGVLWQIKREHICAAIWLQNIIIIRRRYGIGSMKTASGKIIFFLYAFIGISMISRSMNMNESISFVCNQNYTIVLFILITL